jgi:hypothetical protein
MFQEPAESISELLRLYHLTNKSAETKAHIQSGFQDYIETYDYDFELLLPILKSVLKDEDPFLATAALSYVKRCGPVAIGARDERESPLNQPRSSTPNRSHKCSPLDRFNRRYEQAMSGLHVQRARSP